MTDTPMKVVVDCTTGEQSVVPLTAEELAQLEADRAANAKAEAEAQAKAEADAIAKAELLAKLGITEEQAKLLLS